MEPKSLSASSLHVAELCMARWSAEYLQRGRAMDHPAASLGTAVHGALEVFVKTTVLTDEQPYSFEYMSDLFKMSYMTVFGTAEWQTDQFMDGIEMLSSWFKRTSWEGVKVLSAEIKESFPVPLGSTGLTVPLNYIWDRHDQLGETEFRVVDYKSSAWSIRPEDLKNKVQARIYSLACQIKHPEATRIWIEYDMLRHDGPVGIVFTREENVAVWKFIKDRARMIAETPADTPIEDLERLNPECNFCVRKASCSALQRNITVGGIYHLSSGEEAVDLRAALEYQKKAVTKAIEELDNMILADAKARDVFEFESDMNTLNIGMSSRRGVDAERVEMVIGEDLFKKYGSSSITLKIVDKLLKGSELTPEQKAQLRSMIYMKQGEPSVRVQSKSMIDED